ncbi:hypothetical protein DIT71_00045 [Marinobacter vulgaris]|uniref:TniQ domain-containing protein n=1 Tax=Marinobacter vulgaris TaxID=1928331 RepID=A0A2V3ZPB8_9GAMM|nr:TniQ family protein [Marinobacter vulgaris]PXX93237.1 hypothetical protein DIT71_00045 [Marinobacter vulgaris]TSJ72751.1 hypothetical protein FPC41_03220 [Marinobacter vulgaris]
MKRLAARPVPVSGESLNGFLLRVGKVNCLFDPSEIFEVLGCHQSTKRYKGWHETVSENLVVALEKRLERPIGHLLTHFALIDSLSWTDELNRMIRDVRYGYPRICPKCVAERGILDWRWNLAFTSTCPKHSALLVSRCPKCDKAMKWSSSLLIGCYGCEESWGEIEGQPVTTVSSTESMIWDTLGNDPTSMNSDLIHDICRAIAYVMRPFDTIHDSITAAPLLTDHSSYVARAYRVLEDPEVFALWRKECHQQRNDLLPLGDAQLEAPCQLFAKGLLKVWNGPSEGFAIPFDTFSKVKTFPENTRYISPARRDRHFEAEGGVDYRYQHRISSMARVTGWDEHAVHDLFNGEVFPTHKNITQSRQRRFDGRAMISIFLEFPDFATETAIEVRTDSAVFRRNLTTPGRLINAVLRKVVPGGFKRGDLLSSIYVDRSRFEAWLVNERTLATRRSVHLTDVIAALECSESEVGRLVGERKLKWATHREWQEWVDGPSLFEFMLQGD